MVIGTLRNEVEPVREIVTEAMEQAAHLKVKPIAECGVGENSLTHTDPAAYVRHPHAPCRSTAGSSYRLRRDARPFERCGRCYGTQHDRVSLRSGVAVTKC